VLRKQRREEKKIKCRRKRKRKTCRFTEIKNQKKRMEAYDFAPCGLVNTCGGFKRAQCLKFRLKKIFLGSLSLKKKALGCFETLVSL